MSRVFILESYIVDELISDIVSVGERTYISNGHEKIADLLGITVHWGEGGGEG